jgi:hypothetical protein
MERTNLPASATLLNKLNMTFKIFWDVAPCSQVEVDRRFRGAYLLHHQGDEWRL